MAYCNKCGSPNILLISAQEVEEQYDGTIKLKPVVHPLPNEIREALGFWCFDCDSRLKDDGQPIKAEYEFREFSQQQHKRREVDMIRELIDFDSIDDIN